MRVAIATGGYAEAKETQIAFHIERLFGGAKAVLAIKREDPDPLGLPLLIVSNPLAPRSLLTRLQRPIGVILSNIQHGTSRVPWGQDRRRIVSFLQDNQIDAVLCEFGTIALGLAPILHDIGMPVFAYFRGADASAYLINPRRVRSYQRMMLHLDGVFSVAQFLLDKLAAQGICHPHSYVVPSGVDTELFVPGHKDPNRCLAVGRFVEKKRPDLTIKAFCAVARTHPQAVLEMIGEGPMLAKCTQLVQESGLSDRIILHGQQPHAFVRQRMAECTVFMQHSVTGRDGNTEGMPTSVQEAMSCGMIVVSSRHAGIPEAVEEGRTGFLVDEGDEVAFIALLDRTLQDPGGLAAMSQRAREVAKARFDRNRLLTVVEAAMHDALAAKCPVIRT